ncbi:MAG TPA: hypothetical protein VFY10_14395, partial [Dehalococcoidia bacterium]|nr:hypothetical protein [Dehalococcoidia bacterium]
ERSKDREVPPSPVLRRRGVRPGAGADTPAGSNTTRSVKPEKRQQEELEEEREQTQVEQEEARRPNSESHG